MPKIVLLGAGSSVFAKGVLGGCLVTPALREAHIALVDIDAERLADSEHMLRNINRTVGADATIEAHTEFEKAFPGADYIISAIQVGGWQAGQVDIEVGRKYGLEQTVADTLGIGGIFRALRTILVLRGWARAIQKLCPEAWFLNYTNPMSIVTWALLRGGVKAVGLCGSMEGAAPELCQALELPTDDLQWKAAGLNHQAWLLALTRHGEDLYPEARRRVRLPEFADRDAVRFEIMRRFGYFVSESSWHHSEYYPYFLKAAHPELIQRFQIPLDAYRETSLAKDASWESIRAQLVTDEPLGHDIEPGHADFSTRIMNAIETGIPFVFSGSVFNNNLIANLPYGCCVEVLCVADRSGVSPTVVGALPPQCAALNRMSVNVQELTIEGAFRGKREHIYQAAMVDPHAAAELTLDEIHDLVDELIEKHGDLLPALH